jgi:hypothetical protein
MRIAVWSLPHSSCPPRNQSPKRKSGRDRGQQGNQTPQLVRVTVIRRVRLVPPLQTAHLPTQPTHHLTPPKTIASTVPLDSASIAHAVN